VAEGPTVERVDLAALDEIRPGAWLAPGQQMVVNDELVRGLRFAHRIADHELVAGWLEVVPDFAALAAFAHRYALASGGEVEVVEPHPDELPPHAPPSLVLRGPDGWLDGGAADRQALLGVDGGTLTLTWVPLPGAADLDGGPVLATFERLAGGEPVPLLDLVLHLLIDHRALFEDRAPVPLQDLLAVAGLAVEGTTVRRAEVRPAARSAEPVGIPGLGLASALAAERLLGAVLSVERGDAPDAEVVECLADVDGVAAMAEQLVGGALVPPATLAATLDALDGVAGSAGQPGLAFLRSRLAEWEGDTTAQEAALEGALRAGVPAAQVDAAWFAADRGDARGAIALLRSARVPADDPDLALLARYTVAGPRQVGRNDPCWCGSGRKHKQCCLRLNGHDLESRIPWLHGKAVGFLQRPPQRTVLLRVATASAGVANPEDAPARVIAAACDATVAELCLFEGGLFERFVEQRGALLPEDERDLAGSWSASRHRAWEVLDEGRAVRDRASGEERALDERSASKLPGAGLVLGVAQPGPMAFPGPLLPVAEAALSDLLPLLEEGAVEPIAALLGQEFGWTAAPDLGSAVDPAPDALATP
jgi:hypothetical protein